MRTATYSSRRVQSVDAATWSRGHEGQAVVVGVDVSKSELRLVPRWMDGSMGQAIRVRQPSEVRAGVELLRQVGA